MAKIGYARVSSVDQNVDRQSDFFEREGVERIFTDRMSGSISDRPQLKAMLDYVRDGDTLLVESISRLARSTIDFLSIVEQLGDKGVQLISSKESINTGTPQGRFMLTIFSALAELEREQIRERQREGIASARARGKHLGRPKLILPERGEAIINSWKEGQITAVRAYTQLGISKASFYRLVKENPM